MASNIYPLQASIRQQFQRPSPQLETGGSGTTMSDMSREEVDAKLQAQEARTETQFVKLDSKIDRVLESNNSLTKLVTSELGRVSKELNETKTDNKNTRTTIVVTVVASVLAALGAIWLTQSNLLSAFQTGVTIHSERSAQQSPPAPTRDPKSPQP
jgi:hypothetical protein